MWNLKRIGVLLPPFRASSDGNGGQSSARSSKNFQANNIFVFGDDCRCRSLFLSLHLLHFPFEHRRRVAANFLEQAVVVVLRSFVC